MKIGLDALTADMFAGRVGEVFRIDPGASDLELIEVTRGRPFAPGARAPFALLFALRGARPLGSGLHRLVHEAFEADDLFVSRVVVPGRDPRAIYYEAVFG